MKADCKRNKGSVHSAAHRGATGKGVPVYNVARPVMAAMNGPNFALIEI